MSEILGLVFFLEEIHAVESSTSVGTILFLLK